MSTEVLYRYARPSNLDDVGGLALETWTPALNRAPVFFDGFVERADVVAAGLLAVAQVARTRFYTPANMIAAVIRAADPIVTCDGERLRFESLSVCCGVYARLDLLPAGIDGHVLDTGTTNVDVNLALRDALAQVSRGDPLHLDVGVDHLRVRTLDADVVEERVDLPARWTRSLAELPLSLAGMVPRFHLSAVESRRVLQRLPGSQTRGRFWLSPSGATAAMTARPQGAAVHLSGPERLRPLLPLLRLATEVEVHGPDLAGDEPGASSWTASLPGARLTLVLSPEVSRGFSGEGGVLGALIDSEAVAAADRVAVALAGQHRTTVDALATATGLTVDAASAALRALGSAGRVGFDLIDREHYWRELPLPTQAMEAMHPRLADARSLVATGSVTVEGDDAVVRSGSTPYRLQRDGDRWRCSCAWAVQHDGSRGECKHALAVALAAQG